VASTFPSATNDGIRCFYCLLNTHSTITAKLDRFSALLRAYRRGMAAADKFSFLGSLSPWSSASRNASPSPGPPKASSEASPGGKDEIRQAGHSISLRPPPSLRRYPPDCLPLKSRWFYAVDVPKRKPFVQDSAKPPEPKKFVAFSTNDSQAIENAFQALCARENSNPDVKSSTSTK
jgi:hypothetical protein